MVFFGTVGEPLVLLGTRVWSVTLDNCTPLIYNKPMRPKKPIEERRLNPCMIRFTPIEKAKYESFAKADGEALGIWVRRVLRDYTKELER